MSQQADEVKVTPAWFVPHFPPREDRVLEITMLKVWKEYMSYEDHHAGGWCSRLADILSAVPRGLNKRGGRVATTFAVWMMTPLGLAFLKPLLREIKSPENNFQREKIAICAWASENRISSIKRNQLDFFLRNEHDKYVYQRNKYPRLEDHRVVEVILCFFVSDVGKDLLQRVCKTSSQSHSLTF